MRALRWVLTLTVLLAGATAHGAEAVKIRASWIVAPSEPRLKMTFNPNARPDTSEVSDQRGGGGMLGGVPGGGGHFF